MFELRYNLGWFAYLESGYLSFIASCESSFNGDVFAFDPTEHTIMKSVPNARVLPFEQLELRGTDLRPTKHTVILALDVLLA